MFATTYPDNVAPTFFENYKTQIVDFLRQSLQQHNSDYRSLTEDQQRHMLDHMMLALQEFASTVQQSPVPQESPVAVDATLPSSDNQVQTLVDHIADPLVVNSNGIITFANPAAEELFGRSEQELVGSDLGIPFVANNKSEVDILDKEGNYHVAEMRVAHIMWDGIPSSLASFRDVTARKQLEQKLEQTIKDRTLMLQQANERLLGELTKREKAEEAIMGRDAVFEAVEFAAQRFLQNVHFFQELPAVLKQIGTATGVSRVTLFTIQKGEGDVTRIEQKFVWEFPRQQPGINTPPQTIDILNTDQPIKREFRNFPRWENRLGQGLSIYGNVYTFPPNERKVLEEQHISSLAAIPIFVNKLWWGFIELDEYEYERAWLLTEAEALRVAANIMGAAIQQEQTQEALRCSEERLRTITEFTSDWVYWLNPEGAYIYISPSCKQLTGYSPEEFQTTPELLEAIIHPDDRQWVVDLLKDSPHLPYNTLSFDYRIITREQHERWINQIVQAVYNNQGEWLGHRVSNRDITERVTIMKKLRESEALYRTMFEKNTSVKYLVDPDNGAIVDANPAACDFYGVSLEELKRGGIARICTQPVEKALAQLVHSEQEAHARFTTKHRVQSGEIRNVEIYTASVELQGRTLIYCIMHDITNHIETRKLLYSNEEHFRVFVEQTDNIMCQCDSLGQLRYINKTAERFFGIAADECNTKRLFDFVHTEDRKRTEVSFDMWIQRQATHATFENRLVDHNGMDYYMRWSFNLHYAANGTVTMINAIAHNITEIKQIEQALRTNEGRYRTISELISDFAYALHIAPNGTPSLEWATDAFVRTTGFTTDEIKQKGWDSLVHPDDRNTVQQRREWMLSGLAPDVIEFRIITSSGETRWIRNHSRPIWDSNQYRVAYIYGAGQDITERIQTTEALRESEQRYRSLVEISPDIILVQRDEKIIFINDAGIQLFGGYTERDFLGRSIWEIIAPSFHKNMRTEIQHMIEQKTCIPRCEQQFLRLDETPFDVELAACSFMYQGKLAIQFIARDITKRKGMETALRENEQKFRSFFEQSGDGHTLIDHEGKVIDWNNGANHIWGIKQPDVVGRYIWDVMFEALPKTEQKNELYDQLKTQICELLKTRQGILISQSEWHKIQLPDGTERNVETIFFPIQIDNRYLIGSITRDITEQKRSEQELQQAWQTAEAAFRANTEFLVHISHEVRTSLNVVIGMTSLLQNTPLNNEQRDCIETIEASSNTLLKQIIEIGASEE